MKKNLILINVLSTISIIAITTALNSSYAELNTTYTEKSIEYFAVQHAQSGSISEINYTTYTLQLNDVSKQTIMSAERPDRIVTLISTADYIGNWSLAAEGFNVDPPNAAMIVDTQGEQNIAIVELFNPVYDIDKNILKYEIIPVNSTSIGLASELGATTLLLDAYPTAVN